MPVAVLEVLDTYRKIAEITEWRGIEAHRNMLDRVAVASEKDVITAPGQSTK